MDKLTAKALQAIEEIKDGIFQPRKASAKRGTYKLFAALPQHRYTTHYMPIDTAILHRLLSLCWEQDKYPADVQGPGTLKEFREKETEWWKRVFRLELLKGVKVPAGEGEGQPDGQEFGFLMETDGVACSFICRRPRRAAAPRYTPQSVPFKEGVTAFKTIDPGMRAPVTGVASNLICGSGGEDGMEVDGQEKAR